MTTEPAIQNITVRTEEGRRIREAFGTPVVHADLSEIELRVLAHIIKKKPREGGGDMYKGENHG